MPKRTHDGIKKRCGCGKRHWPKCSHPWWFGFHFGGKEHRYSLDRVAESRGEPVPTSKTEAMQWRDRLRNEIRAGEFRLEAATQPAAAPDTRLTFGDVCEAYLKGHVRTPTRRRRGQREMEILIALARRADVPAAHGATMRLEEKPIVAITKADVEAVRAWRRAELAAGNSRPGAKGGEVGINRLLSRVRHMFNWAIAEGYLSDTPFKRGTVSVVRLTRGVEHARTRRLDAAGDEERRVLEAADPHLRAVLVAALSTGCRIGELLSLQWSQIRRDEKGEARWLMLPATKTKTGEARVVPIGPRLRAELSMRRHAADGKEHEASAYVFGDETGGRVQGVRRQWEDAVLRAYGQTPTRKRGKLTAESREALRAIDLHVHDLRREFASRLLESSADLHDVQAFLGHGDITTTSRYLQSTPIRLAKALERLESGFAHDSHTSTPEAPAEAPESAPQNHSNLLN